jgi:hypothetical protein
MKTSDSISNIAAALLKAQQEITFAAKDSKNPAFKSTYANLESVIEAIKGPLNANGVVFMQTFSPSNPGFLALSTRLLHTSGEWIEDEMTVPLQKNDAQGYGSAATYSRRYALAAITGLYQADDDGQEAAKPQPVAKVRTVSADQITAITDAATEAGIAIAEICKVGKIKSISDLPSEKCENLINWIHNNAKVPA